MELTANRALREIKKVQSEGADMKERELIKQHLEAANHLARMRDKLARGDFRALTIADIKRTDPILQEKLLAGAYRQMLRLLGVDYLGY